MRRGQRDALALLVLLLLLSGTLASPTWPLALWPWGSLQDETLLPFNPEDGARLRAAYQARHGHHGQGLVAKLSGAGCGGGTPSGAPSGTPSEFLKPPPAYGQHHDT